MTKWSGQFLRAGKRRHGALLKGSLVIAGIIGSPWNFPKSRRKDGWETVILDYGVVMFASLILSNALTEKSVTGFGLKKPIFYMGCGLKMGKQKPVI